ncbi:MAG: PilZ domain-containing protein [Candidatus Omnitrophota bacterium]
MELIPEGIRQYDRRKHARVVKDLFTVYATPEPFQEGLFKTENISAAGILYRSQSPMKVGTAMNLNIHLPDTINPIPCEARVVRSEVNRHKALVYDIGLAFTRMADLDKRQLIGCLLTQDDFYLFR